VHDHEGHLIRVPEFFRAFLQGQQFIGVQVAFVVRCSFAWQNGFSQVIHAGYR
jgi:hypothetical protein